VARHRIGAVAEQTGLSQHTIRVWQRRYGAVTPERTEGGSRLYSDQDLRRLQLLQRLTADGHSISGLARLPTAQLRTIAGEPQEAQISALSDWAQQFLKATKALDSREMEGVLARAAGQMSPRQLVGDVVAPLATEMGIQWRRGELSIAQEHAGTATLRDLLTRLRRGHNASRNEPVAVAATLGGEKHELGLLMAALVASIAGWNTVYLGTELPAAQIVDAAIAAKARLVMLSMVGETGVEGRGVLRELRDRIPSDVRIAVGGRAAMDVAGIWRPNSLEDFESNIRELSAVSDRI
jgi:DNA-binding transcriptional MerR regulator